MINKQLSTSSNKINIDELMARMILKSPRINSTAEKTLPEIVFITSFPPRECGIATYSQDLIQALNSQYENSFSCTVCALESATEKHEYKQQPAYILNTDSKKSFEQVATAINQNVHAKLIVIQHEFGFFASKEEDFKVFYGQI